MSRYKFLSTEYIVKMGDEQRKKERGKDFSNDKQARQLLQLITLQTILLGTENTITILKEQMRKEAQ